MTFNSSSFPRQRVALSEKDEKWKRACVDSLIGFTDFNMSGFHSRDEKQKYYEYYNGTIDDNDYSHVLKPYGKSRQNFPAKLQNYNMLKPTIDLLLGEYDKRPFNYLVTLSNPDVVTKMEQAKKAALYENLRDNFLTSLVELGVIQQASPEKPPQAPAEMMRQFEYEYRDARAVRGQEALNFMRYDLKLESKFSAGWFDFLVAGEVFSRKDIEGGEMVYEILNPIHVDYDKSPGVTLVEDGSWAATASLMTPSLVVDKFYDVLEEREIDQIENPNLLNTDGYFYTVDSTRPERDHSRMVEVIQVYWKSLKKIGIVTYFEEETGRNESFEVAEGYNKQPGETCEWFWVNEVWEGTRIDGKIYKNIRPCRIQRNSMDNPSICKLPINGMRYSDRNAPNISLLSLGIAYQLLYNIYNYRLENEIAKAKGMIARIDIDSIPEEEGWDMDQWLYYIDALGISFENRSREGGQANNNYRDVLDLTAKTIQQFIGLLGFILESWERLSGVSRQRAGMMSPYDGKGTTEQSIVQSSHITEDYYSKFEMFKESDLQGLMDLSKVAFIGGKKSMYIAPDYTQQLLDLDGIDHMESQYGVFVSGSARENRKVETMRSLTSAMAQQQNAPLSLIAEILDADNFSKLKGYIKEVEAAAEQTGQAQQQAVQQAEEQKQALEREKMAFNAQEKDKDRQTKIQVALITSAPDEQVVDTSVEQMKHRDTVRLKDKELDQGRTLEMKKIELQRQKLQEETRIKEKALNKATAK